MSWKLETNRLDCLMESRERRRQWRRFIGSERQEEQSVELLACAESKINTLHKFITVSNSFNNIPALQISSRNLRPNRGSSSIIIRPQKSLCLQARGFHWYVVACPCKRELAARPTHNFIEYAKYAQAHTHLRTNTHMAVLSTVPHGVKYFDRLLLWDMNTGFNLRFISVLNRSSSVRHVQNSWVVQTCHESQTD